MDDPLVRIPRRAIVAIHIFGDGLAYTTRQLGRATYLGDPLNLVRQFQDFGAHEVVVIDVAAARRRSDRRNGLLERIAGVATRPLSYVGGVRTVGEAESIVELGFERVGVGSLLAKDPAAVAALVAAVGAQSVFAFIDYFGRGRKGAVWTAGRGRSARTPRDVALTAAQAGVGEIVLRSATLDGGLAGLDRVTAELVAEACECPLVVGGGLSRDDLATYAADPWSIVGGTVFSLFRSPDAPMPHFLP